MTAIQPGSPDNEVSRQALAHVNFALEFAPGIDPDRIGQVLFGIGRRTVPVKNVICRNMEKFCTLLFRYTGQVPNPVCVYPEGKRSFVPARSTAV